MLKIDTSGKFAEVQASGDAQELGKELIMVASSLAGAIAKDGVMGRVHAMVMLKTVGTILSDDDYIEAIINGGIEDGIISVRPNEGETEEQTKARATLMALQKFTQNRPIKVDENYNIIDEEDEDEESEDDEE